MALSTADWQAWDPLSQTLLVLFMAVGGMAGSTSGGLEVIRVVLLVRHGTQETFRMVHPQAITPLKLGDRIVPERLRTGFRGFFFVYVAMLLIGALLMALHGQPMGSAFGSVYACPNILGRLEIFTVLVLLTPAFWRG